MESNEAQPTAVGGCGSRILGGCVSVFIPAVFLVIGLGGLYTGLTDGNRLILLWSVFIVLAGIAAMVQLHGIVRIPRSKGGAVDRDDERP